MYIEEFREIMTRLEADLNSNDKYYNELRQIDNSLPEFVSANKHTNTLALQCDYLQRKLFGEELYDWVTWYLYESSFSRLDPSEPNVEMPSGVKYHITHLNSFVDFIQQELGLKQRPIGTGNENKEIN